jgi:hypothetical protein
MENRVITLNDAQRRELEIFVKTGVHSALLIRRAKVILDLDRSNKKDHLRIGRICQNNGISNQAVCDIRKAFLEAQSIEEFLTRKKRETPPVEPKITGEVEARIVALACSEPPKGYARWTLHLLKEKIVELEIIGSLSHMSVKRVLKKRDISLT